MTRKQELENLIKERQEVIDAIGAELATDAVKEVEQYQSELDEIIAQEGAEPPKPMPSQQPSSASMDIQKALATLMSIMQAGEGSGVDSESVRAEIEMYLRDSKIKKDQLDKSVIDFIEENRKVVLELPKFGDLKIELTKDDTDIPYFYEILDDILSGNNVFLIGDAGSGKTYGAEEIAKKLKKEVLMINCSQYTSPTEIVGGQTIDGYKEGKLIKAWDKGMMLILDEMPRLDPNTAGLFNDALAKSSHTRKPENAKISSTNPEQAPFKRNNDFALIATGNVYPNTKPLQQYAANQQQDLSLLDRFSGSVYKVEYSEALDKKQCRFQFLYDMLVGNYHQYMDAIKNNRQKPQPIGLRTVLKDLSLEQNAVVSYRTIVSFRIALEFEIIRRLAEKEGNKDMVGKGKTLNKAFKSFLIAFNDATAQNIISNTGFTSAYIDAGVASIVEQFSSGNFISTLVESIRKNASDIYKRYEDLIVPETMEIGK